LQAGDAGRTLIGGERLRAASREIEAGREVERQSSLFQSVSTFDRFSVVVEAEQQLLLVDIDLVCAGPRVRILIGATKLEVPISESDFHRYRAGCCERLIVRLARPNGPRTLNVLPIGNDLAPTQFQVQRRRLR